MQLVDLKKPARKKSGSTGSKGSSLEPVVDEYDFPYSHGLRFRLGPHEMQKLGDVPGKAGDYVKIVAICKVKERSSRDVDTRHASDYDKERNGETAELCIERLAVMEGDDDADVLESEFNDTSKQRD